MIRDIEITIRLPEDLDKEASGLGLLSDEHIEMLLRADIQAQLEAMHDSHNPPQVKSKPLI